MKPLAITRTHSAALLILSATATFECGAAPVLAQAPDVTIAYRPVPYRIAQRLAKPLDTIVFPGHKQKLGAWILFLEKKSGLSRMPFG